MVWKKTALFGISHHLFVASQFLCQLLWRLLGRVWKGGLANTPSRQMGGPTHYYSADKAASLSQQQPILFVFTNRTCPRPRDATSAGRFLHAAFRFSPSEEKKSNLDIEKSLMILQHKSLSLATVLLTCVHSLPHNDQTQLQPAALGWCLSTHSGASGLCLLGYWKRHLLSLLLTLCHFHLPAAVSSHSLACPPLQPRPL